LFQDLLAAQFAPYGSLTLDQLERLNAHYRLLIQWNRRLNLTRVTELTDMVCLNYCEALFLAAHLPPGPLRVADVGSGAGFPGIPAAIFRPDTTFTLIEAHQRKAVFLREASRGLVNVQVISQRAQDLELTYDWVVSRAVRPDEVAELRISSKFALLTGAVGASELRGECLKVPWGSGRFLVRFHVEQR